MSQVTSHDDGPVKPGGDEFDQVHPDVCTGSQLCHGRVVSGLTIVSFLFFPPGSSPPRGLSCKASENAKGEQIWQVSLLVFLFAGGDTLYMMVQGAWLICKSP